MDSTSIALQAISQQLTDLSRQMISLTVKINHVITTQSPRSRQDNFNNQWFTKEDIKIMDNYEMSIRNNTPKINCCD